MKLIASGLGNGLDDSATMVAIICIEGLGEDAYLRTFVQLGRIPLIDTWPVLPFESNEGALLGVGATPGSKMAALNKSRPFKGSSVKLCSEIAALTVEVVLSIVGTSALAVTCCGTVPTCSVKFMAIAAAGLIVMPSRISVWYPSLSIRTVYFPVGSPA